MRHTNPTSTNPLRKDFVLLVAAERRQRFERDAAIARLVRVRRATRRNP